MNAYMVTSGDYSDYHVHAVFSTKKLASMYCAAFAKSQWTKLRVEEVLLDPDSEVLLAGYLPYFVRIPKDGEVTTVKVEDSPIGFAIGDSYHTDFERRVSDGGEPQWMYTHCWAKDTRHAIKITNERRTRIIAENCWPTGFISGKGFKWADGGSEKRVSQLISRSTDE